MSDVNPTTRRFARTTGEAFRDSEYAEPIWLDSSLRARVMRWLRGLFSRHG